MNALDPISDEGINDIPALQEANIPVNTTYQRMVLMKFTEGAELWGRYTEETRAWGQERSVCDKMNVFASAEYSSDLILKPSQDYHENRT